MLETLGLPYVQRGLLEVMVLSLGAGLIGTWIVLRGLAFYSHAVGTAAFPGLVLADGLGFAGPIGALGAAAVFAVALFAISRSRRSQEHGGEIALVLVGMLALGVILASDVFHSTTGVENLLFGSLLLIDPSDVVIAVVISAIAIATSAALGRRWVARGFDGATGPARGQALDFALLAIVALATAAALTALGALLVAALFVVPAACTRPWFDQLRSWQLATVILTAVLGAAGVLASVQLNAPPGPMIAVLGSGAFVVSAIGLGLRRRARTSALPVALALVAVALVAGCGAGSSPTRPTVVATTPVVAGLVREVAGDNVDVVQILAPNSDPHEYEPRPDDVNAIADADLVFASGGELDSWIGKAIEQAGSNAPVIDLSTKIGDRLTSDEAGADGLDPHWWHDPRNVDDVVPAISSALITIDGADKAAIERSGKRFGARVGRLDRRLTACYASVPDAQRKIVTDHDAFGYLAHRYSIEIIGAVIPALTTEAQPSAGELADLRTLIARERVKAVFPETSVNSDLAQTVASETGASADYTLYGDSLGPPDSKGATYLSMERANAEAIVRGMTGGAHGCPR